MSEAVVEVGTDITALVPVDARTFLENLQTYSAGLKEITVTSDQQEAGAWEKLASLRADIKQADVDKRKITQDWATKKTAVDAFYKRAIDAAKIVELAVVRAIQKWTTAKEVARQEEQRKRDAIAAEERRKAEEKAEAERKKQEQYLQQGRIEMAQKAAVRAEAAEVKAATTVAPVVAATKIQGAGSMIHHWDARLLDKPRAVAACMAQPVLAGAVDINLGFLERLNDSKAIDGSLEVGGVEFVRNDRPRSGRR